MLSKLKLFFNKSFNKQEIIKFQNPYFFGTEIKNIISTIKSKELIGPNNFIEKCERLLEKQLVCNNVLLTASGTDALEMACLLANFKPGDEVLMPSFNFPSAATSVLRCGAKPVFININRSDMNLSINNIKKSINKKTKGIIIVHYAGLSAAMSEIMDFASSNKLIVIEDAAQAIYSKYKNKYLGTLGHFGILSFHQTKNVFCGEGGALLINHEKDRSRANIIREKGTNRNDFKKGLVSKYGWVDIGSSFLPSSLQASFLYAQLSKGFIINNKRKAIFKKYHDFFTKLTANYNISIPILDTNNQYNGHFYWILVPDKIRSKFLNTAKLNLIELTTHFEPLHNSVAGKKFGKSYEDLSVTKLLSKQIIRIPIHTQMTYSEQIFLMNALQKTIKECFNNNN
tara:strand:- start:64 stop:1260 length:1197 start_codon:yes stop_codon:yes gene_type:complete